MPDYLDIQQFLSSHSGENKDIQFLAHLSTSLRDLIARLLLEKRDLFAKLTTSVRQNCFELTRAHSDRMLPATAWAARNLLELMIWSKYCTASESNAVKFQQDAFRDWTDFIRASKEISQTLLKRDTKGHDIVIAQFREAAAARFGIDTAESAFLSVSQAADSMDKDLGLFFKKANKILSKFAHPTAGLIDVVENDDLVLNFTHQGTIFAYNATLTLLRHLLPSDQARS